MKAIIKRVFNSYMKNIIFWIGLLFVTIGIYQQLSPFLEIRYATEEYQMPTPSDEPAIDLDITDGYVPSTPEEQRNLWEEDMKDSFIKDIGLSEKEATREIETMKELNIADACTYLGKKYEFYGAIYSYKEAAYHLGTREEINNYLDGKLEKHSFSYYFSRKFVDFTGLYMAFFVTILFSILFIQDTKKSNYELLHTKPISGTQFVMGKVLGGFLTSALALTVLNVIFYLVCLVGTSGVGFEVQLSDFILNSVKYVLPNMLMIVSVYALIAILFRNPIPSIPLLFLYIVYSNMGSRNTEGVYGYYGRPLAIMVRFPGQFFDTTPPPLVHLNQIFLIVMSMIIVAISIQIWKRRRS